MASSTFTPKRAASMPSVVYSPRQRKGTGRNGTCTHLTMTRLYTEDFRCAICLKTSSIGWLWRCTQDRELMLEEREAFNNAKLDAICDIIPRSIMPRERSPAARESRLSFLAELSEADLQSYTPTQLAEILSQRAHILEVAQRDSAVLLSDSGPFSSALSTDITSATGTRASQSPHPPTEGLKKLWLPLQDAECQFKCCHCCRPSLIERSFLSLDEVAKGGISPTAATGFGFHLQKRPVALVTHVKNLGLRPSPPSTSPPPTGQQQHPTRERRDTSRFSPTVLRLALSIIDVTRTRPSTPSAPESSSSSETKQEDPAAHTRTQHRYSLSGATKLELALHTPLPAQSTEELAIISGPPTPMEESEREGMFGSAPLDLQHGVAVTEEAVGLHVPDLIMQL